MGGSSYNVIGKLFEFIGKLDISRKYGMFAYFCMIAGFFFILPSPRGGFAQFYNVGNFINRLILASIVGGLFVFFERFRVQNDVPTSQYFQKYTFQQQIKEIRLISENNNFGCIEEKGKLSLYNKQIIVEYAPEEYYQFRCSELSSNPKTFKVLALNSFEHLDTGLIKFAKKFTVKTSYAEAAIIFRDLFENQNIYECTPKEYTINSDKKIVEIKTPVIEFDFSRTDINNASEEELAALAGINIVTAKKAIRHRDLKGGFKTFEEFVKVVNLKPKFISQVRPRIEIGSYKVQKSVEPQINDRILDI